MMRIEENVSLLTLNISEVQHCHEFPSYPIFSHEDNVSYPLLILFLPYHRYSRRWDSSEQQNQAALSDLWTVQCGATNNKCMIHLS